MPLLATSSALLRVCFFLLCFMAGIRGLSISEFKVPEMIETGRDAELKCQYVLGEDDAESSIVLTWYFTSDYSVRNSKILLHQNIQGNDTPVRHFNIAIEEKGNDTIVIKDIKDLNAGVYECLVSSSISEVIQEQRLAVLSNRILSIKEFAVPRIINRGRDAELRCQYELGDGDQESTINVRWSFRSASSVNNDKLLIYQAIPGRPKYVLQAHSHSAIEMKDNHTIVLKNITALNSGVYECLVTNFLIEVRQEESLLVLGSRRLSITEFAVPRTIDRGGDAELKCRYGLGDDDEESFIRLRWSLTPALSFYNDKLFIYQTTPGSPKHQAHSPSAIEVKDNDTIVLKNITALNSGVYECLVSNGKLEVRQHESLLVLSKGTTPLLNVSQVHEDDILIYVHVRCLVEEVAPKPMLRVSLNGNAFSVAVKRQRSVKNGLYTANVDGKVLVSPYILREKNEFECKMYYHDDFLRYYTDVPVSRSVQSLVIKN